MKHRYNINKENLWDKIIQDERMPKRKQWLLLEYKNWMILIATLIILVVGYNCVKLQSDSNDKSLASTILSSDSKSSNNKHQSSFQSSYESPNKNEPTSDHTKETSTQTGKVLETSLGTSDDYLIINKNAQSGNRVNFAANFKNETLQERLGYNTEMTSMSSKQMISDEENNFLESLNTTSSQSRSQIQISRMKLIPSLNIRPLTYNQNLINIPENPPFHTKSYNKKNGNIFFTIGYGAGKRSSVDSLGVDVGGNTPFANRLKSYQFELGTSFNIGKWEGRLGAGFDILEGNGSWTKIDTNYVVLSDISNYLRTENTNSYLLYQRYSNVYLLTSLGYVFEGHSWSIVPRAGIRYNVFSKVTGNTILDNSFQKNPIEDSVNSNKLAFSIGLNFERHVTPNFDLTLGAKYESKVTYQLSSGVNQSISSFYLTLGGNYCF